MKKIFFLINIFLTSGLLLPQVCLNFFFSQDWSMYFNEKSAERTHAFVHIKAFKGY